VLASVPVLIVVLSDVVTELSLPAAVEVLATAAIPVYGAAVTVTTFPLWNCQVIVSPPGGLVILPGKSEIAAVPFVGRSAAEKNWLPDTPGTE
jgi:hypothetical protein